jgi:excisionase family DNA binding protein
MKDWMTIKDLGGYLQISENKIRFFIRQGQIPFHDRHGILRFSKEEIDEWMKTPAEGRIEETAGGKGSYLYRDKPVREYALTASKVLIGKKPWERLPGFVRNFIDRIDDIRIHDNGRDFLHRREFSLFSNKYGDYLNVCCQLGLIEKRRAAGREKQYYPTIYARKMAEEDGNGQSKEVILNSVLEIVKNKSETSPDERHAIFLLWYILSLKEKEMQPNEAYFRKSTGELSYYPLIRFNFSKSLCEYLFGDDRNRERRFLGEWNRLILDSRKSVGGKEVKKKLTLFD